MLAVVVTLVALTWKKTVTRKTMNTPKETGVWVGIV